MGAADMGGGQKGNRGVRESGDGRDGDTDTTGIKAVEYPTTTNNRVFFTL
jgi:hypothetical protein